MCFEFCLSLLQFDDIEFKRWSLSFYLKDVGGKLFGRGEGVDGSVPGVAVRGLGLQR